MSEHCEQALRAMLQAAQDQQITCWPVCDFRISDAPATDFQLLALSVLIQRRWITWTPGRTCLYAQLTQRGTDVLNTWGVRLDADAFLAGLFAVSPQEIADETGGAG